jgi:hypothetical protein
MPWPSNLDDDPNVSRMSLECVLTITPATGNITNPQLPAIQAAIVAKTGTTPKSIAATGGAAVVTMPGTRQLWDYIGLMMSAAAANNIPGTVTGYEQGRIT